MFNVIRSVDEGIDFDARIDGGVFFLLGDSSLECLASHGIGDGDKGIGVLPRPAFQGDVQTVEQAVAVGMKRQAVDRVDYFWLIAKAFSYLPSCFSAEDAGLG